MKKIRVLFFDDRDNEMKTVKNMLETTGQFDVVLFQAYDDVLDFACRHELDLIIVDRNLDDSPLLPDKLRSGTGLASRLRDFSELDHVPILVTSQDWGAVETFDQYEEHNEYRGIFAIDKRHWGLVAIPLVSRPSGAVLGAGLVAKIANVLFRWPAFVAANSASFRSTYIYKHPEFTWPIKRR
jgi:CheY-like chemotaxis protein